MTDPNAGRLLLDRCPRCRRIDYEPLEGMVVSCLVCRTRYRRRWVATASDNTTTAEPSSSTHTHDTTVADLRIRGARADVWPDEMDGDANADA